MKYRVLKTLPQGDKPGALVDLNPDEAAVFQLPGVDAVEPVPDEPDDPPLTRRRYQRRDLQATES